MIEIPMSQTKIPAGDSVSVIWTWTFGFVSDFEIRISDFRASRLRISDFSQVRALLNPYPDNP
jgi:hypothetical protein